MRNDAEETGKHTPVAKRAERERICLEAIEHMSLERVLRIAAVLGEDDAVEDAPPASNPSLPTVAGGTRR